MIPRARYSVQLVVDAKHNSCITIGEAYKREWAEEIAERARSGSLKLDVIVVDLEADNG